MNSIHKLCIGLCLFLAYPAQAFSLISLSKVDLSYKHYFDGSRNLVINHVPGKTLDKELILGIDFGLIDNTFYWRNNISAYTDEDNYVHDGQFRAISWAFSLGAALTRQIEIEYAHFSQHLMDTKWTSTSFPVQDSVGIRFIIYKSQQ